MEQHKRSALAIGRTALGALAVGACAIGALALGALVIGRLAVGRGSVKRLRIDELDAGHIRVERLVIAERATESGLNGAKEKILADYDLRRQSEET